MNSTDLVFTVVILCIPTLGVLWVVSCIADHVKEIRDKIFEDLQDGNQEEQSEPGNYGPDKYRQ